MKNNRFLFILIMIIISMLVLSSCNNAKPEREVYKLLKDDLNSSVEIIKLYYNEEKQGFFVEFQTPKHTDKAAIKLTTGEIEYESEFDFWSTQIGKHEYNQKIINSFYAEWNFSVTVFEADGRPEDNDWKRIK